jgi:hypothetical protein
VAGAGAGGGSGVDAVQVIVEGGESDHHDHPLMEIVDNRGQDFDF